MGGEVDVIIGMKEIKQFLLQKKNEKSISKKNDGKEEEDEH